MKTFIPGYRLCSADGVLQKLAPGTCSKPKCLTRSHLVFNARSAPGSAPFFHRVSAAIFDAGRDILGGVTLANKSSFPQLCYLNIMKTLLSCSLQICVFFFILIKSVVTYQIKILKSFSLVKLTYLEVRSLLTVAITVISGRCDKEKYIVPLRNPLIKKEVFEVRLTKRSNTVLFHTIP